MKLKLERAIAGLASYEESHMHRRRERVPIRRRIVLQLDDNRVDNYLRCRGCRRGSSNGRKAKRHHGEPACKEGGERTRAARARKPGCCSGIVGQDGRRGDGRGPIVLRSLPMRQSLWPDDPAVRRFVERGRRVVRTACSYAGGYSLGPGGQLEGGKLAARRPFKSRRVPATISWISRRNGLGTAHFFFAANYRMATNLGELLETTMPPMGYELVDWEMSPKGRLVRVFIDKPRRASDVEDCARVSNHLTHLFTVENVDYDRLEVSSPGLDRPLKKLADLRALRGRGSAAHAARADRRRAALEGHAARRRGRQRPARNRDRARGRSPSRASTSARLVPKIEWRKGK